MVLNPVLSGGVQWAKLGQKKPRFALPPPWPFVLTGDGYGVQGHILGTLNIECPWIVQSLSFSWLTLNQACCVPAYLPANLTAVAFRTQRAATPGSAVCVHRLAFLFPAAQRGLGALRDVGSFDGCPFVAQTRTRGSAVHLGGRIGQSLAIWDHTGVPTGRGQNVG